MDFLLVIVFKIEKFDINVDTSSIREGGVSKDVKVVNKRWFFYVRELWDC